MRILAIHGSPRKKGDTAVLTEKITDAAKLNGHKVENVFVYDLNMKGCLGCMACLTDKVEICVQRDDFAKLVPKIIEADLLIFASPIYFGHITGPLKTFIDRFYTFCMEDFKIKDLPDKKFITIITSGAPANVFGPPITKYLKEWLGDFLGMKSAGSIIVGDLKENSIQDRIEDLDAATLLGKGL